MEDKKNSRSGKRPTKRKFHGNRYSKEKLEENVPLTTKDEKLSASRKKLSAGLEKMNNCFPSEDIPGPSYRLIDESIFLKDIESLLCCGKCFGQVTINEKSCYGLSSVYELKCSCEEFNLIRSCRMLGKKKNIPDVNRRSVLAMRLIGRGASHLRKFHSVMCLPAPITQKAFDKVNKQILEATDVVAKLSTKRAAEEEVAETGSTDVTISGDGSWKTRGHTSNVGICAVIGGETGKVIDTEVMSSYCKGCSFYKGRKSGNLYKKFLIRHAKFCKKNHSGSAGKMEVDGMKRIFQRSIQEKGIQYTSYIGDGDSSTFSNISAIEPYGPDVKIEKIECVGHIQKRMGSRLRKLQRSFGRKKLADGKTIGGENRLSPKNIQRLTEYYGNAIRSNKMSVKEMRKSIWAIWLHCGSTDRSPQHYFCPKGDLGDKSWCTYNKAVAEKTVNKHKHKNTIPQTVMAEIKPIFKDLSDPKLLSRCLGGHTQNPNESFNALVWSICPKTSSSSKTIAEIAVNISTVTFNDGDSGLVDIMKKLDLDIDKSFVDSVCQSDKKRIAIAEKRASAATKDARKAKKMRETIILQKQMNEEGITYESGACGDV